MAKKVNKADAAPDNAGAAACDDAVPGTIEPELKLRLGCCSGLHFLDGSKGICDPGVDPAKCKSRNVCCKGRKIRFRDPEKCI